MSDRLLDRFAAWFASARGVWQTLVVTLAVVAFEVIHPTADPQMLILMAILTIYSAITQPALAYVGWQAGVRTDALLNEELKLIKEELQLLRQLTGDDEVEVGKE
ncbi:hypothetical protein [Mycobacterium colombiense]|uniref:hypothetical protein n=1 Tax=Mycobacterium colombiense TaxID=339268 RepID=UPI0014034F96|nr:hypothetical protein [Mycobacterium colombiense]